uniref:Putative disease resistance RPP13-like protein 1 n=1 Tax=Rhizophora mucronata TaxID=61149 RepID=A0A2P2L5M0_RHIMU
MCLPLWALTASVKPPLLSISTVTAECLAVFVKRPGFTFQKNSMFSRLAKIFLRDSPSNLSIQAILINFKEDYRTI